MCYLQNYYYSQWGSRSIIIIAPDCFLGLKLLWTHADLWTTQGGCESALIVVIKMHATNPKACFAATYFIFSTCKFGTYLPVLWNLYWHHVALIPVKI